MRTSLSGEQGIRDLCLLHRLDVSIREDDVGESQARHSLRRGIEDLAVIDMSEVHGWGAVPLAGGVDARRSSWIVPSPPYQGALI